MAVTERRVLHVDDDPQITRLVASGLSRRGYSVTSVNDPLLALDEMAQANHRVVLLDVEMPGLNGLDLLEKIKHHDGGVLVVMLTGVVSLQNALRSLRSGAEACFFKPIYDLDPLAQAISACYTKIDRWWETIDELSRRRTSEAAQSTIPQSTITIQMPESVSVPDPAATH